jgi:UDPglucose 6-dehydrogenase
VGAGHVGLVSAAGFAAAGHRVYLQDVDEARIAGLLEGRIPFFEPGLEALTAHGRDAGRLTFHTDPADALAPAEVIFVCVSTRGDGDLPDLSRVVDATIAVARHGADGAVLVNRTASPIGTLQMIRSLLEDERAHAVHVAVNPDFLSEGSAVADFLGPSRVVVGAWAREAVRPVAEAYGPITDNHLPDVAAGMRRGDIGFPIPFFVTTPETAEVSKYAADSFLGVKISFINEIAGLSGEYAADVEEVARILASDPRIGPELLRPGLGWGSGRFPKDIAILNAEMETERVPLRLLSAANAVNEQQRDWVLRALKTHLRTLVGSRVAMLGLSSTPSTDDVRSSPALDIAAELVRAGAHVTAFDTVVKRLPAPFDETLELADDALAAAADADALVLVTEWEAFADLGLDRLRSVMRVPLFLDGRNAVDAADARAAGFVYLGVGKGQGNVHPIMASQEENGSRSREHRARRSPSGAGGRSPEGPARPSGRGPRDEVSVPLHPGARVLLVAGGTEVDTMPEELIDLVELEAMLPEVVPSAPAGTARRRPIQGAIKRGMDIVVSSIMLVALLPIAAILCLAIVLDSPGRILYVQRRVGRGGRDFPLLKFRTMVPDAEAALAAHFASNSESQIEWERSRKLRADPRITRIGSFLRRHSVDELPQILNVLWGHMSLVGPRPVTTDELVCLGGSAEQIVAVRPGLTGLWAVSGRSDITYLERAALEHRYAIGWNLWMDMKILVRTIPAVLHGRGAY